MNAIKTDYLTDAEYDTFRANWNTFAQEYGYSKLKKLEWGDSDYDPDEDWSHLDLSIEEGFSILENLLDFTSKNEFYPVNKG